MKYTRRGLICDAVLARIPFNIYSETVTTVKLIKSGGNSKLILKGYENEGWT